MPSRTCVIPRNPRFILKFYISTFTFLLSLRHRFSTVVCFHPERLTSIGHPFSKYNCFDTYRRYHDSINGRGTRMGQGVEPEHERRSDVTMTPWRKAVIDYSGANEYVQAHYGSHPLLSSLLWKNSSVPYFSRPGAIDGKVTEPIYNARELVEEMKLGTKNATDECKAMLKSYGMSVVRLPTDVLDWENKEEIEEIYIEELENLLPSLFSSRINLYCFWNPMRRGESFELSPSLNPDEDLKAESVGKDARKRVPVPTANVAPVVHIDTDIGAYESIDDLLAIVEKNQVVRRRRERQEEMPSFKKDVCRRSIVEEGKRFAVVNFWRNTNRDEPVANRPLAILSTYYDDKHGFHGTSSRSNKPINRRPIPAFPNLRPDMDRSKWYSFPYMTNDELLVFYQYDRSLSQTSDLWHCAISTGEGFPNQTGVNSSPLTSPHSPRESFDIRALIVFDDVVPYEEDRFTPDRVRPVLSFEESGCFCDEQALKRS